MRVTINGITYEGTPDEIRDIVENPPEPNGGHQHIDCPDNDRWNYPRWPGTNPIMTWWDSPGIQRNWDGSPRITCTCLS